MSKIKLVGTLIIFGVLSACGGSSGSSSDVASDENTSPSEKIAQLENKGLLPKLDRSNSLLGPDTNTNGIRDDVEAWINERIPKGEQRKAAYQMARALQNMLTVDLNDKNGALDAGVLIDNASHCFFMVMQSGEYPKHPSIDDKIEAITMNTKQRWNHYWALHKHYNGTVWTLPEGDTCE